MMFNSKIWSMDNLFAVFFRPILYIALFMCVACANTWAATIEQQTINHLNHIRNIKTDMGAEATKVYNRQMDDAWRFFQKNKAQVLPVLRGQLKTELKSSKPNDLILLDIGYFVYQNDGAEGKTIGADALSKLNPGAKIVQANYRELFDFAYAMARDHDSRVLPIIERNFLPSDQEIFIPQHALKLDGTLICVFLYGTYGPESEDILRAKLVDKPVRRRALELLVWLGSPASLPDVRNVLESSPDYETFLRVTSYMMRAAGPAGRTFMLGLSPKTLDTQSRRYLAKIHSAIQETSFESIKASLARVPGDKNLSDAEVKARLSAMLKNYGKDDRTSPVAILNSGLPSEYLINMLMKIRSRILYRLSDEGLGDVEVTNFLINALRYREKNKAR